MGPETLHFQEAPGGLQRYWSMNHTLRDEGLEQRFLRLSRLQIQPRIWYVMDLPPKAAIMHIHFLKAQLRSLALSGATPEPLPNRWVSPVSDSHESRILNSVSAYPFAPSQNARGLKVLVMPTCVFLTVMQAHDLRHCPPQSQRETGYPYRSINLTPSLCLLFQESSSPACHLSIIVLASSPTPQC